MGTYEKGEEMAKAVTPPALREFVHKDLGALEKALAPILKVLQPLLLDAAELIFPHITQEMELCAGRVTTLTKLVEYKLCLNQPKPEHTATKSHTAASASA